MIVAGCPARSIRKRFGDDVIEGLLESRWWDLSDGELEVCASKVKSPKEFIEAVKKVKE